VPLRSAFDLLILEKTFEIGSTSIKKPKDLKAFIKSKMYELKYH